MAIVIKKLDGLIEHKIGTKLIDYVDFKIHMENTQNDAEERLAKQIFEQRKEHISLELKVNTLEESDKDF